MPPTLKDIAQCCGTSVSTVSHVLNDRPGTFIGEATRRRVLDAADELGYRPNELARNLRRQRSMTIGVLAADLGYETHVRKFRAILAAAAERGYTTAVSLAGRGGKAGADAMGKFLSARVEGVIVASFTFSLQAGDLEEAKTLGVPVVAIDPPDGGVLAVRADREAAGHMAASHLFELGRERLVFVGGAPRSYHIEAERHEGFRRAHSERGLECGPERFVRWGEGRHDEAVTEMLAMDPRPDGIVTLSDEVAFALIRGLSVRGVRVPEDVAVVGYNNIKLSAYCTPPLTTIEQADDEIGAAAVEMLCRAIDAARGDARAPEGEVVLKPKLIVRDSSGGRR